MSDIALANKSVSILAVCRLVGIDVPETVTGSVKVYCPFGAVYHSDGGHSPAMRIYPETDSSWCFACSAYFTPVTLYSQVLGIPPQEAAEVLCDRFEVARAKAWEEVLAPVPEPPVDRAELAEALKTWCVRQIPNFDARQFGDLAEILGKCLDLLALVNNSEAAYTWLESSKQVLHTAIGGE